MSRPHRPSVFIATIGAVALALSLAACGRKGPLDPPPGGHGVDGGVVRTPASRNAAPPLPPDSDVPPAYDENGKPIPPEGRKKKFIGDWLID